MISQDYSYINRRYGLRVENGTRVLYCGKPATVRGVIGMKLLVIQPEGEVYYRHVHPTRGAKIIDREPDTLEEQP